MGWSAARKLRRSVDNVRRILAVELVAAARGIDLRSPLEPAPATGAVLRALRETVPGPGVDRFLAPELGAAEEFLLEGGDILDRRACLKALAVARDPRFDHLYVALEPRQLELHVLKLALLLHAGDAQRIALGREGGERGQLGQAPGAVIKLRELGIERLKVQQECLVVG